MDFTTDGLFTLEGFTYRILGFEIDERDITWIKVVNQHATGLEWRFDLNFLNSAYMSGRIY